jgi:pilus assembly protein Flp/PilA
MFQKLINFFKDEEGATMVEYALMLALIAIVCIAAVTLIGQSANNVFNTAASSLPG